MYLCGVTYLPMSFFLHSVSREQVRGPVHQLTKRLPYGCLATKWKENISYRIERANIEIVVNNGTIKMDSLTEREGERCCAL